MLKILEIIYYLLEAKNRTMSLITDVTDIECNAQVVIERSKDNM